MDPGTNLARHEATPLDDVCSATSQRDQTLASHAPVRTTSYMPTPPPDSRHLSLDTLLPHTYPNQTTYPSCPTWPFPSPQAFAPFNATYEPSLSYQPPAFLRIDGSQPQYAHPWTDNYLGLDMTVVPTPRSITSSIERTDIISDPPAIAATPQGLRPSTARTDSVSSVESTFFAIAELDGHASGLSQAHASATYSSSAPLASAPAISPQSHSIHSIDPSFSPHYLASHDSYFPMVPPTYLYSAPNSLTASPPALVNAKSAFGSIPYPSSSPTTRSTTSERPPDHVILQERASIDWATIRFPGPIGDAVAELVGLTTRDTATNGRPKRPMNAFFLYKKRRRPQMRASLTRQFLPTIDTGLMSKRLSLEWKYYIPAEERRYWLDLYDAYYAEFWRMYPGFDYKLRDRKRRSPESVTVQSSVGSETAATKRSAKSPTGRSVEGDGFGLRQSGDFPARRVSEGGPSQPSVLAATVNHTSSTPLYCPPQSGESGSGKPEGSRRWASQYPSAPQSNYIAHPLSAPPWEVGFAHSTRPDAGISRRRGTYQIPVLPSRIQSSPAVPTSVQAQAPRSNAQPQELRPQSAMGIPRQHSLAQSDLSVHYGHTQVAVSPGNLPINDGARTSSQYTGSIMYAEEAVSPKSIAPHMVDVQIGAFGDNSNSGAV